MVLVHVIDHGIQVPIVPCGSFILEVVTEETEDLISHVVGRAFIQVIQKILCFILCIEIFGLLVRNKQIVLIDLKIEVWRCRVVIEKDVSKDVDVLTKTFCVGHPNKLQLICVDSLLLVSVVETCKEPGIESHLGK